MDPLTLSAIVQGGAALFSGLRNRGNSQINQASQAMQNQLGQQNQYANQAYGYLQNQQQNLGQAQGDLSRATQGFQGQVGQFQDVARNFGQAAQGFQGQVGSLQDYVRQFQGQVMPQTQNVLDPSQSGWYQQLMGQYNSTTPGNFMPASVRQAIYNNAMQPLQQDYEYQQRQAVEDANRLGILGSGSLGVRQGMLDQGYQRQGQQVANAITEQDFQTGLAQQTNLRAALQDLQNQAYSRSMGLEQMRIGGAQAGLGGAQVGFDAALQGLGAQQQGLQAAQMGLGAGQQGLGAQQQLYGNVFNNYATAADSFSNANSQAGNTAARLYQMGRDTQQGDDAQFQALAGGVAGAAQTYAMPSYLQSVARSLRMPTGGSGTGFDLSQVGGQMRNAASNTGRYFGQKGGI